MEEINKEITYEEKLIYILDVLAKKTVDEEKKNEFNKIKNKLILQKKDLQKK